MSSFWSSADLTGNQTSRYNAIIEVMREYEGSHGIKWEKL